MPCTTACLARIAISHLGVAASVSDKILSSCFLVFFLPIFHQNNIIFTPTVDVPVSTTKFTGAQWDKNQLITKAVGLCC